MYWVEGTAVTESYRYGGKCEGEEAFHNPLTRFQYLSEFVPLGDELNLSFSILFSIPIRWNRMARWGRNCIFLFFNEKGQNCKSRRSHFSQVE
jgi:hypothetical protein